MASPLPVSPFDQGRFIGTVTEVAAASGKLNLPFAAGPSGQWLHGAHLGRGAVGDFVFVECAGCALFARILSVKLPEKERLSVDPEIGRASDTHPLGVMQFLATVRLHDGSVTTGVETYPRIGASVFAAHPVLVQWLAHRASDEAAEPAKTLDVAHLPMAKDVPIRVTPERLFGRHCAVLGATGGGKSWTVARLLEESARYHCKVMLFDATGEFHTVRGDHVRSIHLCEDAEAVGRGSTEVVVPYRELTEQDLFVMFNPSGQAQAPKMRAAMKSLKVARLVPALAPHGFIAKAGQPRAKFEAALKTHAKALENPKADFDITHLSRQVDEECVFPSGRDAASTNWGNKADNEAVWCVGLMTRIESMIAAAELRCLFRADGKRSVMTEIEEFLTSSTQRILRFSLRHLSFAFSAREIVANAVGRWLLEKARTGAFKDKPLVVFLDEAHQFLGKSLGDEGSRVRLDAFELVAKEGRKFGLTTCLATQRPRDIPQGVLSQMGTLLVHRLTNHEDREVVERASGDIDRSASAFLPTLAPGQAILIGVDFPIPLTVAIAPPTARPDSTGPDYQKHW